MSASAVVPSASGRPLGVIDIGSNSGRITVYRQEPEGHLTILADARSPLRLARDVGQSGRLGDEAIDRTVRAVRDFMSVAAGAGAQDVVAVATSAVREAEDAGDLVARVREETGLDVEVIDGDREAVLACIGAVYGLPVEDGLLVDLGGGSVEVSSFRDRRPIRSWTLPLGALRLSDRFLRSDPPAEEEVAELRAFVEGTLTGAGIHPLHQDQALVMTGGTVRNMARIDERRHRWPIPHLHGYVLVRERVDGLAELITARKAARRQAIPGLAADRADSIAGGALGVQAVMEAVAAEEILVSGQGLREGVALSELGLGPSPAALVRQASVAALVSRFATWDPERAGRRARTAETLAKAFDPGASPETQELLEHAARLLDTGRTIDQYERAEHAAAVALAADLAGFSHAHLAMLAAILRQAGGEDAGKSFGRLLSKDERRGVRRAGLLLGLAEEIERRTPPSEPVDLSCDIERRQAVVSSAALAAWDPRGFPDRFRRAFGRRLVVRGRA